MNNVFQEEQRFNQWWLWLIMFLGLGTILYPIYTDGINGETLLAPAIFLPITIFLYLARLKTRIDKDGIHIEAFFLIKRSFAWSDIRFVEVVDYGFVGGWGVRYSVNHGRVYNVSGKIGIAISLRSNKKVCVGTQCGEDVSAIIKRYMVQ